MKAMYPIQVITKKRGLLHRVESNQRSESTSEEVLAKEGASTFHQSSLIRHDSYKSIKLVAEQKEYLVERDGPNLAFQVPI